MANRHQGHDAPFRRSIGDLVEELCRCFGHECSVFNVNDGRLLHESRTQPNGDEPWRSGLVRDAASREEVAVLSLGGPIALLTLPLEAAGYKDAAALGVFVLSRVTEDVERGTLADVARPLATDGRRLASWMKDQPVWTCEALSRLGAFALDKLATDRRVDQLDGQLEELSERIGESYEEISLVYRVTERLRGSSGPEELAREVLDWSLHILPAEQAIIEFLATGRSGTGSDSTFLSFGERRLDSTGFRRLIDHLKPNPEEKPLVLNAESTEAESWPFPGIRELIVVPLQADRQTRGWLAVLNHAGGGWFGTPQARLLNAAATIIGMRAMMQEMAELRDAAEAANAAKSAFLANVSHEFRTPLNGIVNFARLLSAGECEGEAERRDCLQTIDECCQRLLEAVDDILGFSKLEAEGVRTERFPCRLDEVILGVVSELQGRAARKGLHLEATGVAGALATVQSDPARLRQVLTILVRNAIKFSEHGVIRVDCRVTAGDHRKFCISVCDTGIGIPSDKLECICEPFVQADGSATRRHGGLGLGLAICSRIARSLGGELTVQSQPGKGSTFALKLDAGSLREMGLDQEDAIAPMHGTIAPKEGLFP